MLHHIKPALRIVVLTVVSVLPSVASADGAIVYPAAVLAFQERGADVKDYGGQVSDILFAELAAVPELYLVDRQDLQATLGEQALNLSGAVNPDQALQVGRLTGAKLLITGSVFQVGEQLYLVAKVMGTETSQVAGTSVKGPPDDLAALAEKLAGQVAGVVRQHAGDLVPKRVKAADRVAALQAKLGETQRPAVLVTIAERHISQTTIDPAAETEITLLCRETGFVVLDAGQGHTGEAEITLKGEGFSELAGNVGPLVSVRARLEVKAADRSGKIVAVERQTAVVVGPSEQIAAKQALQEAAGDLALRLLPKLVAVPK